MIHIFFDCGSFGSTIESVLHNYTDHSVPIDSKILDDGSMHSFRKEKHVTHPKTLEDFLYHETHSDSAITTPTYPFKEFGLPTMIEYFSSIKSWDTDTKILIFQPDLRACELNLLFKYHKVCTSYINAGLDIIIGDNQHNIVNWNQDYTHWSQMKTWELREWLSLYYREYVQEFINSQHQVTDGWLKLTNTDILYNTKESLLKIIDHCGLTNTKDLTEFVSEWQQAQKYIVDEFNLLDQIVKCAIDKRPLNWQPINIIAEAIVQQRLRSKGYEIRCNGLDKFPTDAIMLNSLLEKIESKQMRKLYYMGLESYEARYTLQLTEWNRRVFDRRGLDVVYVPGTTIDNSQAISVGQVLDAHGRSYFSMSQMMNLVQMMKNGEVTNEDVIYFEDMFQPGIESLPYILNQVPADQRPRVYVRCLAQSIDPDDFVHVWGMAKWMGLYEQMVNEFVDGVLATNEEMVAHMRIAGWRAPIYNISGLAFGKQEVLERIGGAENIRPFDQRPRRVGFAARFDQEKQPGFFMDLIEMYGQLTNQPCEFAIFQGGPLRSNNPEFITRARQMEREGKLKIYENLSKNDYYALLNDTRVLFNCALQDWVSNTVSEADTLGCNVVYPAYRSFPETFANDPERLYVPWSIDDAYHKMQNMLHKPHHNMGLISDWNNGTVDRVIDIMTGQGEQWNRAGNRYRDHVAHEKYQVVKIEE